MYRILDLFSGIGGFSLAAHWVGWETAAFVEWEKYPQKVLAKNFSGVPIYSDIKDFHYEQEKEKIGPIDIVTGGFPCQPFSTAGNRKGTNDDRYLWPEMLRVIREAKPTWVVGENVAGLLTMDSGTVFEEICTSLEDEGYTVESFVLPAISVGAPHRRDRVWILGKNTKRDGCQHNGHKERSKVWQKRDAGTRNGIRFYSKQASGNAEREGLQRQKRNREHQQWQQHWYAVAARLCRMDDGIPSWVDRHRTNRLKALGNSIVPQVAYEIFKEIKEHDSKRST